MEEISKINTSHDLAEFIRGLSRSYKENPETWENGDLASYLEAMSAWIIDAEGTYLHHNQPIPTGETLRAIATILAAGQIYE